MPRLDAILERLASLRPGADLEDPHDRPRAAVAAILREVPGAPHGADLFFIRRAEHPSDPWSGHIAFPGGRRELTDARLVDTAVRETREEVGLDLGRAELVGRLPDLPAMGRSRRTNLVVTPFVFAIRQDVVVTPNYEVAGTLWVPFRKLVLGEGRGTFTYQHEGKPYDLPCIRFQPEGPVLWGMTYRMLETMLEALGAADEGASAPPLPSPLDAKAG